MRLRTFLFLLLLACSTLAFRSDDPEKFKTNTHISFPEFDVIIYDFNGYTGVENFYDGDTSRLQLELKGWNIPDYEHAITRENPAGYEQWQKKWIAKNDSVPMYEDLDNSINDKLIRLIPKNSSDKFKVSVAYHTHFFEVHDHRNGKAPENWYATRFNWRGMTKYETLRDSADHYYRTRMISNKNAAAFVSDFKKKFSMRDTSVLIPREYSVQSDFAFGKDRLAASRVEHYCIRIERYSKNKLAETKYLIVWINDSC